MNNHRIQAEGAWGGASWDGYLNVGAHIWHSRCRDRSSVFFKVVEYNPLWEVVAQKEADDLKKILSKDFSFIDIQHVGSTSIPGMSAKPIIQLMIGVDEEFQTDEIMYR